MSSHAPVPPGRELVPGYRVVALLARGHRLDTYDCLSLERDCRVVVKVVRPDRRDQSRVREALVLEGALLTSLQHPHLVRGYETLLRPEPAVVLEMLAGTTVTGLQRKARLGPTDAALLGRQLVSVLGYLHDRGWLHLDVKPDNVVIREGGAVLIDLGLARPPGELERGLGTDGFAAPEQERGGVVSPASDVWGVGATLLACTTGRIPGRRPDLTGSPRALRPVLASCLRREPDARPSLVEVRDRLEELLGDPPRPSRSAGRRSARLARGGPRYRYQRPVAAGTALPSP